MPSQENFENQSPVRYSKKCDIEGLGSFKRSLEKYFFSNVVVRDCSSETTSAKLVLELDCNFGLVEMLHHLKLGTWGNFSSKESSFSKLLQQLKDRNDLYIEVEEFSIILKDTSIVINKIFDKSIPEQLENILEEIGKNYVHFTRGLTNVPYEIYIPVFEESVMENDTTLMNIKSGNNCMKDYFKYWGIYFYSEEDAMIYDVRNTAIISGSMQMLNR